MKNLTAALIPLVFVVACGDDDMTTPIEGEQEVITTVNLTLTTGVETSTASWRDVDGPGGADPIITHPAPLTSTFLYAASVEILNETVMPPEDVTEEIRAEAEEHRLFYEFVGFEGEVIVTDSESTYGPNMVGSDLPVGLEATLIPTSTGTGALRISLRHLPPINGVPAKTAGTTIDDGEGDFDITFDLTVE